MPMSLVSWSLRGYEKDVRWGERAVRKHIYTTISQTIHSLPIFMHPNAHQSINMSPLTSLYIMCCLSCFPWQPIHVTTKKPIYSPSLSNLMWFHSVTSFMIIHSTPHKHKTDFWGNWPTLLGYSPPFDFVHLNIPLPYHLVFDSFCIQQVNKLMFHSMTLPLDSVMNKLQRKPSAQKAIQVAFLDPICKADSPILHPFSTVLLEYWLKSFPSAQACQLHGLFQDKTYLEFVSTYHSIVLFTIDIISITAVLHRNVRITHSFLFLHPVFDTGFFSNTDVFGIHVPWLLFCLFWLFLKHTMRT